MTRATGTWIIPLLLLLLLLLLLRARYGSCSSTTTWLQAKTATYSAPFTSSMPVGDRKLRDGSRAQNASSNTNDDDGGGGGGGAAAVLAPSPFMSLDAAAGGDVHSRDGGRCGEA